MKKKLRFVPLATAAILALGMSSVSAKTIYYSTNGGDTMKAFDTENASEVAAHKEAFRTAQNKGWKIVVKDGDKIIDWKKAADAKQSYTPALADNVAYQGKQPTPNSDGTWTAGDAAPSQKVIKSIKEVTVTLKANETLQAKVPTVEVTYTDNTTASVAVTWGNVDMTKVGVEQTVQGTVANTTLKAVAKVTVEAASQEIEKAVTVSAGLSTFDRMVTVELKNATDPENYVVKVNGKELKYYASNKKFSGVVQLTAAQLAVADNTEALNAAIKEATTFEKKAPAVQVEKAVTVSNGLSTFDRMVTVELKNATDPENYVVKVNGKELKYYASNKKFSGVVQLTADQLAVADDANALKTAIEAKTEFSHK